MRNVRVLLMLVSLLCFVAAAEAQTQSFSRAAVIPAPADQVGGFGNVVAGVDFDNDGKLEIYAVNNNWADRTTVELTPAIFKYEFDGSAWQMVWSTALNIPLQNTWPPLAWGDLDKDGKKEIIWGPVNFTDATTNPNPARIVVFETKGDGSDVMGVDAGGGLYKPNAQWPITDQANQNLRPFRWFIVDIDKDGADEIVASLRAGTPRCQIYSVDNIPDNADGSEKWTLEFSGATGTNYDLAIIDTTIYLINSAGGVTPVRYSPATKAYTVGTTQASLIPGGSWKSSSVVDIDKDGVKEIVVGGWGPAATNDKIFVLQQNPDGTLKATQIADLTAEKSEGVNGGAAGDIDNDGLIDFVFGTRNSVPLGVIHRLEYKGGSITDPNNYEYTVIDKEVVPTVTQYDVVVMANLDADPDLEIVYSGTPRGYDTVSPGAAPQPLVILDLQKALPVELASFTVSVIGNGVELKWTTATETNNYGFEVQRSTDQKTFQRIGFVAGNGTTTSPQTYRFLDHGLSNGTYYYRLKQIDTDGTVTMSESIRAEVTTVAREYALHQNYPNPFNPTTTIAFDLKEDGLARLRVFNMLGQQVAELVNGHLQAGTHTTVLDARNLASGNYIYVLEVNGFRAQKWMQIIK
ncbi:MAG: T9SS type A sorting domain-containing protein [candidate division KSB1 bacterium]|nr:T9SS type A sorting domain-containing protein [candidate division KSB1 bacterium]MDZ7304275.1 T9SS type A sorting domain-containing protein [candidate division KSB1 bacterium]MDZ7312926.1 T9SS type A sorting domain-containing protein [candidate division KSB1 bacterium]